MTAQTAGRTYSIKEAAALTGLPASTLRYYESIGVIRPIGRGESSKHRVYGEDDLDQLMSVACLSATGMSINDMRQYVTNIEEGPAAAGLQIGLLAAQAERLEHEAAQLAIRQEYVALKIEYWRAVDKGRRKRAAEIAAQARSLADTLQRNERAAR